MKKAEVGIIMGSDSDWDRISAVADTLERFGVKYDARVISAHRTPELAAEYAAGASKRGIKVIIAAAGGAAHLAGVVAAQTSLPVIGLPVSGGELKGVDALLSTVQMPGGIPVAAVTLGRGGPVNAAVFAVRILALGRPALSKKLRSYAGDMKKKVKNGNRKVQSAIGKRGRRS
ncbi:MAG: 5-(carboxyamino)imidazole ribonucleotide mutase [Kiritimatiellia bacterium]